jgi:hypothetical protein
MIRKSLFWGLTLVLVAALVSLVIRGRRMEKEQAAEPTEVVRQAPASPVRVLAPRDLEIASSTMQVKSDHTALHEIELRNRGTVSYSGILLKFAYQDNSGKSLETRTCLLDKTVVLPGGVFRSSNLVIRGIPAATKKYQVTVQSADMQSGDPAPAD